MTCRFILTIAIVLIALSATPKQASAQLTNCMQREVVVNYLKTKHNENSVSYGMTLDGTVLEIFASPSGSWTMLLSYPTKMSCVIETGKNWTMLPTINDDDEKGLSF